ncbi:MAG: arginine N-succinyltransferase [Alteromonadaceae bacterium]|nr:arginine N-succinyltransferase [Alteromonadaceae bacterium]
MMIIRPIRSDDYPVLFEIAKESGVGFTSLPVNEAILRAKISHAEESFSKDVSQPGPENYLFVMEDVATGEVVGTSGIEAAVGLDDAFYSYHHGKVVHSSRELEVHNELETLTLCNDYTGTSEICTLFLREGARGGHNGRFLSKFRFLFIAEHSERFSESIIAEMRGVSDEEGRSPFWKWLEEHFFSMDFPTADYLTGIGQKVFIAELMPKYPIYVNLLSDEAQQVIGKVHEKTKPALNLLLSEGFNKSGYVDIFDAGPTVEANVNYIRTAQASRKLPVEIGSGIQDSAPNHFVINTKVKDFRGVMADIQINEETQTVLISEATANALGVAAGEDIRFAPIHLGD